MAFNWTNFFSQHRIEYVTSGPSVTKGNIAIRCPWCGHNDPSQHLSISTEGKGYHCWRNREHRGRSPVRLIQALIKCSYEQAAQIAGVNINVPEDFFNQVQKQLQSPATAAQRSPPELPKEFKVFARLPSARPFFEYLHNKRGFLDRHIARLAIHYDIRYCVMGPYKYRIIFPVTYQDEVVTWTGRTIAVDTLPRYKTLSADKKTASWEGYPPALGPISDYLLWYDHLIKSSADTIYLVEGPFDAAKVTVLGEEHGICATCFFTSGPSEAQVRLLHELLPRFKRRLLLLDRGSLSTALYLQSRLLSLDVEIQQLPEGMKDPGELQSIEQLIKEDVK